jgi:tRNA A37 N6-isopentenylltransferase MiaA
LKTNLTPITFWYFCLFISFFAKQNQNIYKTIIVFLHLAKNSQKGDFLDDEDRLAKLAGAREDKYLQAITKARETAEKANDRETVVKIVELYEKIQDKIEDIETQRRQKVIDSQIWALEKEIEIYGESIEKIKALVVK